LSRYIYEKITNRQLFYILFMMRVVIILAILPVLTATDAEQDAWIASILSFFGSGLLMLVVVGLSMIFPNHTFVEYSQIVLGPWLGRLVSMLLLLIFLWVAALDIKIYSEALASRFLIETPVAFIAGTMVLASVFAAYSGVETIARCADVLFPVFIFFILFGLLAPLPQASENLINLEPILARGWGPVIRSGMVSSVLLHFIVISMLTPTLLEPKKILRTSFITLICATVVLTLITLMVITVLGPHNGKESNFPFFVMLRSVQLSEFLERIEVFAIFSWGFGLFIGVSVFLLVGAKGISQLFGLEDYRPLVGPMGVIWVALSIHAFDSFFEFHQSIKPHISVPLYLTIYASTYGVVWVGYILRKLFGGITVETQSPKKK
jgi:spore germination protein KB